MCQSRDHEVDLHLLTVVDEGPRLDACFLVPEPAQPTLYLFSDGRRTVLKAMADDQTLSACEVREVLPVCAIRTPVAAKRLVVQSRQTVVRIKKDEVRRADSLQGVQAPRAATWFAPVNDFRLPRKVAEHKRSFAEDRAGWRNATLPSRTNPAPLDCWRPRGPA